MKFFQTFRVRLLIILSILLITTLGVQYYLNLKTEEQNEQLREIQHETLLAGIGLGFNSMSSSDRLRDYVKREGQPFLNERATERIKDIIVINNKWEVYDSLNEDNVPTETEDGETQYKNLQDLKDLPPLLDLERLGEDSAKFPNADSSKADQNEAEAHAIPIETDQGRWYVMVILKTDRREAAQRAARPLIYTLALLLISSLVTIFLVWRYTRPIADLSQAVRQVAEGERYVRVPENKRTDEMGNLATQFNEMATELEKKRELEMQLQQAEKSAVVGRLGSAIAHEIRNPLNYINLTLDHLRAKFTPEDNAKREGFEKLTAQLKAEVGRINRQISDFLGYSRPTKPNLKPLDVREVVKDSLRIVEAQAGEQNIKISLIEQENISQVLGDAEFLRSVFNNLFINALQEMETTGGNLNIKISSEKDFVKIEVADTGAGISDENISKIFEPYFSTKETGTGLGLAIVKKIIDVHNGMIAVETNLNEGTIFTVRLPSSDEGKGTRNK